MAGILFSMADVKGKQHRVTGTKNKVTLGALQQELADLRAQNSTDTKKMFALLYSLGAKSTAEMLGKPDPDDEDAP
jgi:hypothetical protein